MQQNIVPSDAKTLRELATRVREIALSPENLKRKDRWYRHNALNPGQPMIFGELGGLGANNEHPCVPMLTCSENWARDLELSLRTTIYQFDVVKDDWVVEPFLNCNWRVDSGSYGVKEQTHSGTQGGHMGSYVWEPPLANLQGDLAKLQKRTFRVDREATYQHKAFLEKVLGDILPVRIRGSFWWTMGMTQTAIRLVGLEQLMVYMVDDPEGLHRLMEFLHDDHLAFAKWLESEKLFSLNNENDYIGSGSVGYTRDLPKPDHNAHVRMQDLWCLSESQETVGVGPEMFGQFIFPYQKSLIEHFGLCYYGCCEPVHSRWHILRGIANLRKVSISPWCDEAVMSRELSNRYVYCRKPNPALISTDHFDESAIRADLRKTLTETRKHGCIVEIVMKDVHTLQRQPERMARWVQIAREESRR